MGHAVDLPHRVPQVIFQIQTAHAPQNAGVGDVGVHLPVVLARSGHQGLDVGLLADIAAYRQTAYLFGHLPGALQVEIGHHHATGTVCSKTPRNAAANAAGATGHDGDFVSNVHG
jgi:hypothetical protein